MKKLWNRFLRDVMSTIVVIIFDVIIFILILIYFNQTNVLIVLTLFLIFSCFLIVCTNYRKNSSVIREKMTNMFLVVVSVLTGIYMTEFFLHIATPQFLRLEYSITGKFTDFTDRGYFNSGISQKKDSVFRILGLGDSFAEMGRGQWNYHDILQRKYDALYGIQRVEVINAGIASTGPGYYWNTIERYGDIFKPDLVIVGFFIGNDFVEMKIDDVIRVGLFIKEPRDLKARLFGYLKFKNLWLYQYAHVTKLIMLDELMKKKEKVMISTQEEGTLSEEVFYNIERNRMWIFEKINVNKLNDIWNEDSNVLLEMKGWCDKRNIPLVIMMFPDQIQVETDVLQDVLKTFNINEDTIDIFYPNNLLKEFLEKNNIRHLDLTTPMNEAAQAKKLYPFRDTHWNKEGNEEAANIIFDYLQKNNLLSLTQSRR